MITEQKKQHISSMNCDFEFRYLVKACLDRTNWSPKEFTEHTDLDKNVYYNLKSGKEHQYTKRIVVTLAVAFGLKFCDALFFIEKAGYSLMTGKRVDEAYISLLVNYPGYNISVCNDKLIDLGIDEKDLLGPVFYTDKC